MERLHCDAKALVRLGKLAGQPAGDHIEISRSLAREDARPQSPDGVQVMGASVVLWPQRDRPPEVHRFAMRHRSIIAPHMQHARRHHAHHRERLSSQFDLAANDSWITVEPALPQSVAQNHDVMIVRRLVFLAKLSTQNRSHSQHVEKA